MNDWSTRRVIPFDNFLRKRKRPGHKRTQFWVSKADIPTEKEKEEEWETINLKIPHYRL
jgi:hypothetical protein